MTCCLICWRLVRGWCQLVEKGVAPESWLQEGRFPCTNLGHAGEEQTLHSCAS